jgi:ribonuclease P protein component
MMCQDLIDFDQQKIDGVLIVRFGYLSNTFEQNKKNLEKLLSKATM